MGTHPQLRHLTRGVVNDMYSERGVPLTPGRISELTGWLKFQSVEAMHSLARQPPRARFLPGRRSFVARVLERSW